MGIRNITLEKKFIRTPVKKFIRTWEKKLIGTSEKKLTPGNYENYPSFMSKHSSELLRYFVIFLN